MFIDFFFFYYYFFYLLKNCTLPKPHLVSCGGKTCELEQTCHISVSVKRTVFRISSLGDCNENVNVFGSD